MNKVWQEISTRVLPSFILAFCMIPFIAARSSHSPPRDENILLIIVDTLRADHLGCYGGRKGVSPVVDRLAEEGVQFMNAYSTAPWTKPAVASILTSLYPSKHGVGSLVDVLASEYTTLPEMLKEQAYTTAGIVSHKLISSKFGFAQGFNYLSHENARGHDSVTSFGVTSDAIRWLKQNGDKKFFLMLHYFDPHYGYQHHAEFNYVRGYSGNLKPGENVWALRHRRNQLTENDIRFLTDLYDEEIRYTDKNIGLLIDYLRESGLKDKTLIVLTADHGEEFMTRGWIGHTRTLYQELLHVPLIINYPKRFTHKKVSANVSTLDIGPTIFDSLKISYEESLLSG